LTDRKPTPPPHFPARNRTDRLVGREIRLFHGLLSRLLASLSFIFSPVLHFSRIAR
jgi:hypothetical protein